MSALYPETIDIYVSNQQIEPLIIWVLEPSWVRVIPFHSQPPPTTDNDENDVDNDENVVEKEPIAVPEPNIMEENNIEAEDII